MKEVNKGVKSKTTSNKVKVKTEKRRKTTSLLFFDI